ncbi:MBL fold metallo-hydrolase [Anaplasmataceae bacterium AB001_6]|nr:MBL fold metallo-hydrolase [Anaplasmataceae bacterium AB001_6]
MGGEGSIKTTSEPKGASNATKKENQKLENYLPFDDETDIENAYRGFIGDITETSIEEKGVKILDTTKYDFIEKGSEAPDTVNPSLWRQSGLTAAKGLFKVTEEIYQIRGFDVSNMTFIKTKTGWVMVDPLTSPGCAKAGYELAQKHLGKMKIKAVIFTHSHLDHFGGVKGVVNEKRVKKDNIQVIAPENFVIEAVNENLMAGNTMSRRASYMYGSLLPGNPKGDVGVGLGANLSSGKATLIKPDTIISKTPTKLMIDGVEFVFINTPHAEAPAELMFYIPQYKALCQSEEVNHTLHNLLTPRGAQVRDALLWSKYIHDTIERFGKDVEVSFGSHNWSTWGNENIMKLLKAQRDVYRYIHDETLRLANKGLTMIEIAEYLQLPDSLAKNFANRSYYGHINHGAKAQYQKYFGFFSGNPSDLHPLVPVEEGKKVVEYMGGSKKLMHKVQKDIKKGEYRWAATVLKHLVFSEPHNQNAKNMLADVYEQLGYQSENGPWRNFYLTGAQELRGGVKKLPAINTVSPDMVKNMELETYLDFIAVRLNHPKAADAKMTMNFFFPDKSKKFVIYIEHGVMNYTIGKHVSDADCNVQINRSDLDLIQLGEKNMGDLLSDGKVKINGDKQAFRDFFNMLDNFEFWFNIVTPNEI